MHSFPSFRFLPLLHSFPVLGCHPFPVLTCHPHSSLPCMSPFFASSLPSQSLFPLRQSLLSLLLHPVICSYSRQLFVSLFGSYSFVFSPFPSSTNKTMGCWSAESLLLKTSHWCQSYSYSRPFPGFKANVRSATCCSSSLLLIDGAVLCM
jgi:hypothetical protein